MSVARGEAAWLNPGTGLLVALVEMRTPADVDRLADVLAKVTG